MAAPIRINDHYTLKGLTIRPLTWDDIPALDVFIKDVLEAETGKRPPDIDDLIHDYQLEKFSLESNTRIVADADGNMLGLAEVWDLHEVPVRPQIWARTHPEHLGQGIGTVLMDWAVSRTREVFPRVPADARVTANTSHYSTWEASRPLLESIGFKPYRHAFQMLIEMDELPPEPVWPESITLKTYSQIQDPRKVYAAITDAFKDHFGYIPMDFEKGLAQFIHRDLEDKAFDADLWFLAVDGDEIAGINLGRKWSWEDKENGYISVLGVRRPWRKRGLGLALLRHSFREYYNRGYRKVDLHVDGESLTGAVRLYEKAGMRVFRRIDQYELELRPGKILATTNAEG